MREFGPIQVIPPGLLGFFELKTSGRNPDQLLSGYQPALEMFDWLMEASAIDWNKVFGAGGVAGRTVAAGNLGYNAYTSPSGIVVPATEAWWVISYTIVSSVVTLGTSSMQIVPAFSRQSPAVAFRDLYAVGAPSAVVVGGGVGRVCSAQATGFFVPPGSDLGFILLQNETATANDFSGFLRYVPLSI